MTVSGIFGKLFLSKRTYEKLRFSGEISIWQTHSFRDGQFMVNICFPVGS